MLSYLGHVLNALNCVQTQSGSSYSRREGLLSQTQYGEMSTGPACRQTPHKLLIMRVDINILACLMPGSQQTHSVRRACEWGRYRQRGLNDLLICAGLIWISEPGCWEALLGRWADCRRSVCVCVCVHVAVLTAMHDHRNTHCRAACYVKRQSAFTQTRNSVHVSVFSVVC